MKSDLKRLCKELVLKLPSTQKKKRKYLENIRRDYTLSGDAPSIIASTCIGGMISHNLGQKFMSPTINIWMTPSHLTRFVCDLDKYLSAPVVFVKNSGYDFPVGKICDITVYFQHYHTEKEALDKWNERKTRLNPENLYIITDDKRLSSEELDALTSVKCKRLVIFTAKENQKPPFFSYNCYKGQEEVGFYSVRGMGGFAPFEKEFNYAKWLSGKDDYRIENWSLMIK